MIDHELYIYWDTRDIYLIQILQIYLLFSIMFAILYLTPPSVTPCDNEAPLFWAQVSFAHFVNIGLANPPC